MNFGDALKVLKSGGIVWRQCWEYSDEGTFLYWIPPIEFTVSKPPLLGVYPEGTKIKQAGFINIHLGNGYCSPWTTSNEELLAEDWEQGRLQSNESTDNIDL